VRNQNVTRPAAHFPGHFRLNACQPGSESRMIKHLKPRGEDEAEGSRQL